MTSFEYVSKASASLPVTPHLFHYFQPIQGSLSPSTLLSVSLKRLASTDEVISLSVPSPCNFPFTNVKPFAFPSTTLGNSPDRAMPHPIAHVHTASSLMPSTLASGTLHMQHSPCIHPSLCSGLKTDAASLQKPLEPSSKEMPAHHISLV